MTFVTGDISGCPEWSGLTGPTTWSCVAYDRARSSSRLSSQQQRWPDDERFVRKSWTDNNLLGDLSAARL